MKVIKADRTILPLIQLITAIISAMLTMASYKFISIRIVMLIFCGIFLLTGAFLVLFYLPLWFRRLQYSITNETVTKRCGVFFTTERTVRFSSVQFADIVSFPFSKFTGLNFIILSAYGGKIALLFLKEQDKKTLLKNIGRDYC